MSARRTSIYWFKLAKHIGAFAGFVAICVGFAVVDSLPTWFLAILAGALGIGCIVWLVLEETRRLREVEMGR